MQRRQISSADIFNTRDAVSDIPAAPIPPLPEPTLDELVAVSFQAIVYFVQPLRSSIYIFKIGKRARPDDILETVFVSYCLDT